MTATMVGSGTNWSGNVTFSAPRVVTPRTATELGDVVCGAQRVRAVGTRHSFNTVADCDEVMVSLADMTGEVEVDPRSRWVSVPAGVRFGDLYRALGSAGLALGNTGALPHISAVGGCVTGSHGSGNTNPGLAAAVTAVELMTADGGLRTLDADADPDVFGGAVVSLGCLGVVTRMRFVVEPAYRVRQDVYEGLSFDAFTEHAEEIFAAGYSVSLFTRWADRSFGQVWLKTRLDDGDDGHVPAVFFGAVPADGERHPSPGGDPLFTTAQQGVPGPWFLRLPHFRLEFTPSDGEEIQSEYFVPREDAAAALRALEPIRDRIERVLLVSELRTIAADGMWLSPAYQRDSVGFAFTWKRDQAAVEALLPDIEARLEPFQPRPHWGKVFTMNPDLVASRYRRLEDFRALAVVMDPAGRFRNPFTDPYVRG